MAIAIRKLSGDDAARYFPARSQPDVSEYLDALRGLNVGDIAEVQLGEVSVRAMKRRLTTASKQLGLTLQYSKQTSGEGAVGFRVKSSQGGAVPRRRGRPPKNAG